MNDLLVYTAGVLTPAAWERNYRRKLPEIPGIKFMNPKLFPADLLFEDGGKTYRNLVMGAIKVGDELWINKCDIMLVEFEDWKETGEIQTGTSTEVGMARALRKRIVAVASTPEIRRQRHFPLAFCDTVVDTLEEAYEILRFCAAWQTHPENLQFEL